MAQRTKIKEQVVHVSNAPAKLFLASRHSYRRVARAYAVVPPLREGAALLQRGAGVARVVLGHGVRI